MTTSYFLAVDVGTSRTAAATARISSDGTIASAPFALGRQSDSTPSVVFIADGELLFGDAAARRGVAQPERLVREFKRRIGDEIPILAGGRRFSPEQLYALLVTWVIDTVTEVKGRRPKGVSVTVPVTWGEHRTGLVVAALARAGWRDVRLVSEPEAAARHYEAEEPLAQGELLAVYDLGGGTFDTVLLRKNGDAVDVVGDPVGMDAFGGSDFDDLVLRHAVEAAGLSIDELASDPDARVGLATLKRESVEAKESLSFDAETVIPVLVGERRTTVRLTRGEFETMIEHGITRTVDVVAEVFTSAGVKAADVRSILLTGGSSRIPRIAQLLSERFDRPVAVDADPKAIISLGAARIVAQDRRTPLLVEEAAADDSEQDAAQPFVRRDPSRRRFGRGAAIAAVGAGALVLAGGIAFSALSPLGDSMLGEDVPSPAQSSIAAPTPTETPGSAPAEPGAALRPTSAVATAEPLLTPAPPGVVIDLFPLQTPQPDTTESGR